MPVPNIGTSTALTTAGELIQSIRDQIPDPVSDPALDGSSFSLATLLRYINSSARIMAASAPIVMDWFAIQSEAGMDVYELPNHILSVEQLWYDMWPCWRAPELDALFVTKITSRSYFFGPHSIHATPRIHVWPAADRTGANTTLSSSITDASVIIPLTSVTGFKQYGFALIESELVLYRTVNASPTNTLTQVLRGQGGTAKVSHNSGAAVAERNIFFKCSRLPVKVTSPSDPVEIPIGLVPLLELGVLARVREAEQEAQEARSLRQDFDREIATLAEKAAYKGLRQGIQVRTEPPGPLLYYGRVYVPSLLMLMASGLLYSII